MTNILELASHYFIVDPFSRPMPRKVPALRGPNTSRILMPQSDTTGVWIVSA